jgi:DNA-binding cell septation regulator SpoVG
MGPESHRPPARPNLPKITVTRLERVRTFGRLRGYASVRLSSGPVELRFLRIIEGDTGTVYVSHPVQKTDDGQWVPVFWIPEPLREAINAAVLAAYDQEETA